MSDQKNIFNFAEKLKVSELHFKIDPDVQLFVVIALHNTHHGPAIGGARWISYPSTNEAIHDAIRLAQGMAFKTAISKLPNGGGKAVLIRPEKQIDKEKYFATYAELLNNLGGRYITAVDAGTNTEEMDILARYTKHVTSTSAIGNPSILTALGVLHGIEAAIKFKLNKNSFKDLHIAIQGAGQVGYLLSKLCHERGAKITIADTQPALAERCATEFHAKIVSPEMIHAVSADVFSPCALGGILNQQTIPQIQAGIIAGSANNQLSEKNDGQLLHARGIFYAPDYVINAGGLIQASGKYYAATDQQIEKKVKGIYHTLMTIFERAARQSKAPSNIADELALERLEETPVPW